MDCCDWVGITCNNFTGDVISLNLRDAGLQGRCTTVGHLEYLV
ncbi:putative leucine-rich repeat domain superfamily [Helianthus debilis subsp. tardiflorus]